MVGRNSSTGRMMRDVGKPLPKNFEPWIVKFMSKANDHAEIGPEEYAYSLMAKAAAVDMPRNKIAESAERQIFCRA